MSRYERIMADIDAGLTDEALARRYMFAEATSQGEHTRKNAVQCMHVYRMVHDGTLTPSEGDGKWFTARETIADRLARLIVGWYK